MKNIIHLIILVLCVVLPSSAQDNSYANPIYIAAILVDEPDEEDMAQMCEYYGFTEAPTEGDYRVFTNQDGTKLRFNLSGPTNAPLATVEVNNIPPHKQLQTLLPTIGYNSDKSPNTFIKGSRLFRRFTTCTIKGNKATFVKQLGTNPNPRISKTPTTSTKRKLRKSSNPSSQ